MKTHSYSTRRRGFTLVELLVVIAIVAVLAGMSFVGVTSAMTKARKTQSEVAANALVQGINNFYNEYSRLPEVNQKEIRTDSQSGIELLEVLMAMEDGNERDNSRSIRFLQLEEGKGRRGLSYNRNNQIDGLFDAFGNPYVIVLNIDYEDELRFSYGGAQYELRGEQAAVYSPGADEQPGTVDDITTFRRR